MVIDFLNRTSEKIGFKRERFDDANTPTDLDDLLLIPFFTDFKYSHILSSFILKNYLNKFKSSKYVIACSYPGFSQLFPYVDEFWTLSDFANFKKLYENSEGFHNKSTNFNNILRSLNENFRNVLPPETFDQFYYNGFKDDFYKNFGKSFNVFYPMVPSSAVLGKDFLRVINQSSGYKIFIHPAIYIDSWKNGRCEKISVNKEFYVELIKFLRENNFFPVVWNYNLSYNLTEDFKNGEDCLFLNEYDIFKVLSAIRTTGCVLDVFNGISRLAKVARVPSLVMEERSKYFYTKEYELDDFTRNNKTPNLFVYTFMSSLVSGSKSYWKNEIFLYIKNNLLNLVPYSDRESWPTTEEIEINANVSQIREPKNKRLGTRFVKINSFD